MATELLQPGVSVIQEFRSVSPTIVTPTLVPCAIAPAFQVLEALETDATGNQVLNTDAVASVPAIQTAANPGPYAGLDGLTLLLSVNGGAPQTVTFSDPTAANLDAGAVKDQIATAALAGVGAFVSAAGASEFLQLRTTATGDGQTLQILNGTANSVLGFNDYFTAEGVSNYNQDKLVVEQDNFPDPRGIIDELDVDEASIRVFVNTGQALREFKRDETFLRKQKGAKYTSSSITFPTTTLTGKKFAFIDKFGDAVEEFTFAAEYATNILLVAAMNGLIGSTRLSVNGADKIDFDSPDGYLEVVAPSSDSAHSLLGWVDGDKAYTLETVDDGDGDQKTPTVVVDLENFNAPAAAAQLVGTATLTGDREVHNLTFILQKDGCSPQTVTFDAGPITLSGVYDGTVMNGLVLNMLVNGVAKQVTFSGGDPIAHDDAVTQINAAAGIPVAYRSDASGVYNAAGTYMSFQVGGATAIPGGDIQLVNAGSTADTMLGETLSADKLQTMTIAEIITAVNATMGTGFSSNDGTDKLQLDSPTTGAESKIEIGNGTANTEFGFTNLQTDTGQAYSPKVGDALWGDGAFVGNIAVVAPGGNTARLQLDREVALTYGATSMYIQAQNIASPTPSDRPKPDLVVNSSGAAEIKHDMLRNTDGEPISAVGQLVIAYSALRLDVTPKAANPALLNFEDTITLGDTLDPINLDNPLGLMMFFMLINAPGVLCSAIGVDATNSSNPDGTPEGFSRSLVFLESEEVYALAPSSQDPTVHQIFVTHVNSMSDPDAKGERIVFINPEMPGEALPVLVTSGTDGDSLVAANEFDTKLASLSADVLAAGVNPVGTIPVSAGLYLDITADAKRYNIASISGTEITIRVAFSPGENDDGFYSSTNLPSTLISETFSVNVRGAALVDPNGDPDYNAIAETYQGLGQAYGNRRVCMVAPEEVGANIDGLEQKIKGYYLCAALAGMVGQLPPQQGFTNFPITGFTQVFGSNDVFNQRQMNVGAAGGTYWVVQEVAGGPLSTRHQLTTDLTSIETRELSITKVVDFTAKFMRAGLRNFIGKFNITQPFLDTLSTVVQGQLSFLTESGVLVGGDLNNIVQDESAPDTVLIDVTLDVPFPANYIRLTLVI
jgi:hypothetical protein